MTSFPRVLISAPQAKAKAYCFERFIDNVMQFKYPNFDVKLFDNTLDDGEFTSYMNSYVAKNHGKNARFEALNTCLMHKMTSDSVIERMARSHNDCRDFTLRLKYDYILHLETDLFPPHDIIEQLMFHTLPVVSALYYVDNGIYRKPMIQRSIRLGPRFLSSKNFMANEDLCFCDGTVKKVAHAGLGCILIHRSVLEKVKFRHIADVNNHPDTYFAEDCAQHRIPIHIDTSIVVEHENSPWGVFGLDYK